MMELACIPTGVTGASEDSTIAAAQCPNHIVFAVCHE
jgi:hypothetical protein